jgi:uncharacterized protein (DUF2141 family)
MKANRKLLAIIGLATVPALYAQVVDYSLQELGACVADMQAFCPDVPAGGGRRIRCVREHAASVSPACKAAVVEPNDLGDGQKGVSIAVTVEGIKSDAGTIWVQLSDDPDSFPQAGRRMSVVPARPGSINVTFRNLKPGVYAVFVYHDANDNSKLDTNFMGLPNEGVGYSNKATGIPNFKASALRVSIDSKMSVALVYY